ncbi:PQQ-binding-like beta-propeller repeat protein [Micromonospora sp. NPDC000089]|uniref:outer membrane protein assembly factor BamB family protein n=1 Tax=unclassified Micromonospora TaxID=2617518 RepID=UPI00368432A1
MPRPGATRAGIATAVSTLLLLTATPTTVSAAPRPTPVGSTSRDNLAVTYQINARHDGNAGNVVGAPPLRRQWARDLGGGISYPVIAGGKVFVTARTDDEYGTTLFALDAATGRNAWAPVFLGGIYWSSSLAYGDGRVYAVNFNGQLTAFDAATGHRVWTVFLPDHDQDPVHDQYIFTSPPVFQDGVVYLSGGGYGGRLFAVDAATGAVRWQQPVESGTDSSPAVTPTGVYAAYGCQRAYGFTLAGTKRWEYNTTCTGGGGMTPVVADGALWLRDLFITKPVALDLATGAVRHTFGTGYERLAPPAFLGRTGFFVDETVLQARSAADPRQPLWTFTGDGEELNAPIVVNGYVYVGSFSGTLWAIDPTTGKAVWSTKAGAAIVPSNENKGGIPLTGMAAGQGRLIVPAANVLVSFGK